MEELAHGHDVASLLGLDVDVLKELESHGLERIVRPLGEPVNRAAVD
jgi:hypothetical protein